MLRFHPQRLVIAYSAVIQYLSRLALAALLAPVVKGASALGVRAPIGASGNYGYAPGGGETSIGNTKINGASGSTTDVVEPNSSDSDWHTACGNKMVAA